MSDVKKWYIGVYGGDAQARPCSPAEIEIIHAGEGRYFVLAEDFDNATRLFLDAAERCVASERREKELQQRLTAADEREDALGSLVLEAELALKALNVAVSVYDVELADNARRGLRLIIAALKPAEGSTCNQVREESGLPVNTPCQACGRGACIDR